MNGIIKESMSYRRLEIGFMSCINQTINSGRSYEKMDVNINNCFFIRLSHFAENGGVISISGGHYSVRVSRSIFSNCSSIQNGGAIFYNDDSNIYLSKVCAFKCSAFHGLFSFQQTNNQISLQWISLSNCENRINGYGITKIIGGYQTIENSNCSMNIANYVSSVDIKSPSNHNCRFSTISNNHAISGICITFSDGSGNHEHTNIFHNNGPNYGVVYIEEGARVVIQESIFDYNTNILFYIYSGFLNLMNSVISHNDELMSGSATNSNSTYSKAPSYFLTFFSTWNCLTDIPITPFITIQETTHISQNQTPINMPNQTLNEKEQKKINFKFSNTNMHFGCSFGNSLLPILLS